MSAFKDAVANDVKAVFINLDEHASEHNLNGETVSCIVDKDLTTGANDSFLGVFLNTITIYVDANDIVPAPVENEIINFDGKRYTVRSVSVEEGILVIIAEANEQ